MTARARRSAPRLAPTLALVAEPTPQAPTWAVQAATSPAALDQPRDLIAARERIWHRDGRRFAERTHEDRHHTYRAYERADCLSYGVTVDELTYGRIDTRKPVSGKLPGADIDWLVQQQREALDLIRSLCPETVGEHDAGHRVYPGPGYVLVLRPQERLAVLAARRSP